MPGKDDVRKECCGLFQNPFTSLTWVQANAAKHPNFKSMIKRQGYIIGKIIPTVSFSRGE
jgi:hypothetical protein